jgi:hypothetical protein
MREFEMRTSDSVEFANGLYVAELASLEETRGWQEGAINPGTLDAERLQYLAEGVMGSLQAVATAEFPYSDCTDGRFRLNLQSGELVPVRQQLVGADTVTALVMAEALGPRFYGNDKAKPRERVQQVVQFLGDNGLEPSTHESCGAAGGLVPVLTNMVKFSANPNFQNRQREFVPGFDQGIYERTISTFGNRLSSGLYEGYSDAHVTEAVLGRPNGSRAVARYRDDGTGVKGHRESFIVRLVDIDEALNPNQLAEITGGAQVFGMNDKRMAKLAELFGRGHDEDYLTALTAAEAFSDAGHGTLGSNLQTLTIRKAA